jgi:hypothetical protein
MAGGFTYTDEETVSALAARFDNPSRGVLPRFGECGADREARRNMGGWRKSTYSDGNGGSCVEIASGDGVMVRDTTDRDGVTLEFPTGSWAAFLMRLRP